MAETIFLPSKCFASTFSKHETIWMDGTATMITSEAAMTSKISDEKWMAETSK